MSKERTTGYNNLNLGVNAGNSLTTGYSNINLGVGAGYSLTTGHNNLNLGVGAGYSLTGTSNINLGVNAGYSLTTGNYNLNLGVVSGVFEANGTTPLQTNNQSLFLGAMTKALLNGGTNEIVIGYNAIGNGSNSVTLGNSSITKTILNGNVGIGTTEPSAKLSVVSDSSTTGNAFDVKNSGGTELLKVENIGRIKMLIPTSPTGLTSGYIWNDGGTLKIIT